MHQKVLEYLNGSRSEADTIEDGFVSKEEFTKQCAADSGESIKDIAIALEKAIAEKAIEQKTFKLAGTEGNQKKVAYVRLVESTEGTEKK